MDGQKEPLPTLSLARNEQPVTAGGSEMDCTDAAKKLQAIAAKSNQSATKNANDPTETQDNSDNDDNTENLKKMGFAHPHSVVAKALALCNPIEKNQ